MAVEIGKLIAETLAQLPEEHSDRKFLAGQLKAFEAFNARSDGRLEAVESVLETEWQRQAEKLASLFAKELGMSEKKYLATLPKFPERPPVYDELKLTVPSIVETRVPWLEQIEIANLGITDYLKNRLEEMKEWEGDPQGFKTPDVPYAFWGQDGTRYVHRKPVDVRGELHQEERGGTHWDGLGLAILHPDMVQRMFFDLIGSQVGLGGAPSLDWWLGRPRFHYDWIGIADPHYRALVCGRKI